MKQKRRVIGILLILLMTLTLSLDYGKAFGAGDVRNYGFTASNAYTYQKLFDSSKTFSYDGQVIGRVYYTVIKAKSNTTSRGSDGIDRYTEVILVRTQMVPDYQKVGSMICAGLNSYNRVQMWLEGERKYFDMAPEGTMPSSSSTCTSGVGVEIGGADLFKFTFDTGYSTTIQNNCVKTHSSFYKGYKFDADYSYSVYSGNSSDAAKKATNLWATNKHNCYYAFMYSTPCEYYFTPTSYNNYGWPMTIRINFRFRVAKTSAARPSQWDGDPDDVLTDSATTVKKALDKTFR